MIRFILQDFAHAIKIGVEFKLISIRINTKIVKILG